MTLTLTLTLTLSITLTFSRLCEAVSEAGGRPLDAEARSPLDLP